jgi:hypothetical protein
MSPSKFSTELDSKITGFLLDDTPSLSACSRVSKYHRVIAEPHLYKDIVFKHYQNYEIRSLSITRLDPPSVALHIKRFTLADQRATEQQIYAQTAL